MKIFGYMGPNDENVSRVSWKMWKIERSGRVVTTWWGPATVVKRKLVPRYALNTKSRSFRTEDAARKFEAGRIADKLAGGYERFSMGRR